MKKTYNDLLVDEGCVLGTGGEEEGADAHDDDGRDPDEDVAGEEEGRHCVATVAVNHVGGCLCFLVEVKSWWWEERKWWVWLMLRKHGSRSRFGRQDGRDELVDEKVWRRELADGDSYTDHQASNKRTSVMSAPPAVQSCKSGWASDRTGHKQQRETGKPWSGASHHWQTAGCKIKIRGTGEVGGVVTKHRSKVAAAGHRQPNRTQPAWCDGCKTETTSRLTM